MNQAPPLPQQTELGQPTSIELEGSTVDLLGTAHISQQSRDQVVEMINSDRYDAVAVELCDKRYQSLLGETASWDLWQMIRERKLGAMSAMLVMSAYQQRLAEQIGTEPGLEMKIAIQLAKEKDLQLALIDRDIGITMRRLYRCVPWWQRSALLFSLLFSLFSRQRITAEEIEKLKQGDFLDNIMQQLQLSSKMLFRVLITERDRYMAATIIDFVRQHRPRRILVVIGAGHQAGVHACLHQPAADTSSERARLTTVPPRSRYLKLIPWLIVALIMVGFVIGFRQDMALGWDLLGFWIVINGGLSALGALIAAASLPTIVTAFIAAPLTSLNPMVGAGMVAASAEMFYDKPRFTDFQNLRMDTRKWSGWRRNRVARLVSIYVLSSLGSVFGTYVGGVYIYQQLF